MTAVTRHVYYVPESLADDFEQAFTDLGVSVVVTSTEVTDVDANNIHTPDDAEGFTPGGAPIMPAGKWRV